MCGNNDRATSAAAVNRLLAALIYRLANRNFPSGAMFKAILLAVPALVLATSCVPQQRAPNYAALAAAKAPQRPVKDPRELLQRLELDVPTDLVEETALARIAHPAVYNAAPAFDTGLQAADDAARALDCLTQAVYYEARSEPVDGERAVAQVVLNRVRDRAFPKSVCGVVYQGSERRTGCQFTFTCDGSLLRPREAVAWARARAVAVAALAGARGGGGGAGGRSLCPGRLGDALSRQLRVAVVGAEPDADRHGRLAHLLPLARCDGKCARLPPAL